MTIAVSRGDAWCLAAVEVPGESLFGVPKSFRLRPIPRVHSPMVSCTRQTAMWFWVTVRRVVCLTHMGKIIIDLRR